MDKVERPSWGVLVGMVACVILGLSVPVLFGWIGDEIDEAHPETRAYCVVSAARAEGEPTVHAGELEPTETACGGDGVLVCGYYAAPYGIGPGAEPDEDGTFVSQECPEGVPD